jgi:dTDP-4-dehydrorhamnose 3,5-epimerase
MQTVAQRKAFKPPSKQLIAGVETRPLKPIVDERGFLMEMIRSDDPIFKGFAQSYLTAVNDGVTKAWHYHNDQTDNFVCVFGLIKLVLYDCREDSPTYGLVNEFFIGERNPMLVQIPPKVLHGFKGISAPHALVVNFPDRLYNYENPDEFRVDPHDNDVPYDWTRRDG